MADNNKFVQAPKLFLSGSGISSTATSIQVTSLKIPDGTTNITMSDFGTIGHLTLEPGTANEENVSFTGITQNADGSATFTGVTRGLGFTAPYAADASLRKPHAGSTLAVVSDSAPFFDYVAVKTNDETITGVWTFNKDTGRPQISADEDTAVDEELVTFGQLARQAIAGAADATTTVAGLVEKATSAETQAGTDSGSEAELFAAPSDIAKNIQNQQFTYQGTDTGAADAYAVSVTPNLTAYAEGQRFSFKAANANTGVSTLAVDGLATVTIKKLHDQDLEANDIESGAVVEVIYDGTNFQLQTPTAGQLSAAIATETTDFFSTTNITGAEAEQLTNGSEVDSLHSHDQFDLYDAKLNLYRSNSLTFTTIENFGDSAIWTKTEDGTSSVTDYPMNTGFLTDASSGSDSMVSSAVQLALLNDGVSTDKEANFDSNIQFVGNVQFLLTTNQSAMFGITASTLTAIPTSATLTARHYGFLLDNGTLYASMADGTTQETESVAATLTDINTLKVVFTAGSDAKFYINNSLVSTLNTNVPTGGTGTYFTAGIRTGTAATRAMSLYKPFVIEAEIV